VRLEARFFLAAILLLGITVGTGAQAQAAVVVDWSAVPVQGMTPRGLLSVGGITCTSTTACVAAGYLQVPNPKDDSYPPTQPAELYRPLLWHWDGHEWLYQTTANPGSVGLVGTACLSGTQCWAVGAQSVGKLGNQFAGVIDSYNGKAWRQSPLPDATGAAFNAISCPSTDDCLAVGARQTSLTQAHVLVEHWDGKTWAASSSASPKGAMWSTLDSVSCFSPTSCVALGDAQDSAKATGYFFGERFNGTSWSLFTVPNPQKFNMGNESGLFGLSCPSTTSCLAVGTALDYTAGQMGADFPGGVAETWDGSTWAAIRALPQSGQGASYLPNGDSCPAVGHCWVALGVPSILGPLSRDAAVAQWDGSSFVVSSSPTKGFFSDIGCLKQDAGNWCMALGETPTGGRGGVAMLGYKIT